MQANRRVGEKGCIGESQDMNSIGFGFTNFLCVLVNKVIVFRTVTYFCSYNTALQLF